MGDPDDQARHIGWALVGQIVNSWAIIDQCADEILLGLRHADETLAQKVQWRQLSSKLSQLGDLVDDEGATWPFAALARHILSDAATAYKNRNDLVHGTAWFQDIGRVHYTRWRVTDDKMKLVRRTLRTQDLLNFAVKSGEIAKNIHALTIDWKRRFPLPEDAIEAEIVDS